jgi:very-short-patch-repair endonuclease
VTITRHRLRYRGKASRLERRFELLWHALSGPELVSEFQFHSKRKWRADFAHIDSKTLIEIEGGIWLQGRHNRATGFIADMEKYNEATLSGWRIFRLADVHLTLEIVGRIRECIVAMTSSPCKVDVKQV